MKIFGFPVRVALAPALLLCACAAPPPDAPESHPEPAAATETSVSLNQEFTLSPGDKAVIAEKNLTVEFAEVTEDSRCPVGARCIWAGQVTVLLRVAEENGAPAEPKLTLRVDENKPASEQVGGLLIRLLSVEPYPEPKEPIQRGDYAARLVVEEGPSTGESGQP